MDNQTNLLPVEAITAELLEKVAIQCIKEDEGYTPKNPPAFWAALLAKGKEAYSKGEGMYSVVDCYKDEVERHGASAMGGAVLKLIYLGWRMADLYLKEQLEKTAD